MDASTRFQTITSGDPDLNGLSSSEIDTWLEIAAEELTATSFSANYQKIAVHLAAHLAKCALGGQNGQPGVVSSESQGGVSVSYEVGDVADQYDKTSYGRRYKTLRDKYVNAPRTSR